MRGRGLRGLPLAQGLAPRHRADTPIAERWPIVASLFVCSEHLGDAEQAMTENMGQSRHPWTVETFRMYGWDDDDGRGAAYRVTRGEGTDHIEQLPLF